MTLPRAAILPVSPLRRVLLVISGPWVSITLLVLIFLHQSIGSAFYPLRQAFEMNELQWFNGWVSAGLWGAICVCQTTASFVRVPWTWARGGAHLTHLSVVLMVIAAAIYFGNKFEGETLLLRRGIELTDGDGHRALLLPNPGYAALLGDGTARVESVIPQWSVLTPDGKPTRAWAVMVTVQFPDGKPFSVTLIADRPELTQYTSEGRTPISYLPSVGAVDAADGVVRAFTTNHAVKVQTKAEVGAEANADGWSLSITAIDRDCPLLANGHQGEKSTLISFTIKTPAGQQSGSAILGYPELTRFQRARTKAVPDARLASATLVPAPVQRAYHQDRFALWWRPAPVDEAVGAQRSYLQHPLDGLPRYREHGLRSDGVALAIPAGVFDRAKQQAGAAANPADTVTFTVTGFAPYAAPVSEYHEDPASPADPLLDLVLSNHDGEALARSVALSTEVAAIDAQGICWLRPADEAGCAAARAKLEAHGAGPRSGPLDPETVRLLFLSSPHGNTELLIGVPGQPVQSQLAVVGVDLPVRVGISAFSVRIRNRYEHPRSDVTPVPVPTEQRQSRMSVGMSQAWIEVEARKGSDAAVHQWVAFSPFPEVPVDIGDATSSLGGYAPKPSVIEVPGAGRFELMFSRVPFALPGPIWMTDFTVPRRPGSEDPMEFFCGVAYGDAKNPRHATVHMNEPLEWDGTFFFQASWDPGMQALSVLGVGNRPGGGFLLIAAILLGVGMVWSGMSMSKRGAKT